MKGPTTYRPAPGQGIALHRGKEHQPMNTTYREDNGLGTETPVSVSRKDLLRRAGVGAGVLALGGAVAATATPALARSGVFAVLKASTKVTLGWGGATCEAPLWAAYHKGFFAAEGLDVDLLKVTAGYNTSNLLSSGKLSGAQGIVYTFLKP